jgi:hypothetical protein
MEKDIKRKVTRTLEEKKALCEEWKASGKTKSNFCKEKNIPLATFFPWCKKFTDTKKEVPNILPVKIINKAQVLAKAAIDQTEIELHLGSSTVVRFKLPMKEIVTFIQELSHAVATIR